MRKWISVGLTASPLSKKMGLEGVENSRRKKELVF